MDNFQRVRLIEAHNCIFNYDLVSICETSLNDSVELPETLLNNYWRIYCSWTKIWSEKIIFYCFISNSFF